ncbi:hypothetical protein fugu_014904 [Takifugu bimaculatus]|uniref:Uncharacterized protein n=1 Tax=Takifugu bimaculatus TaxID=433685 RepID=A0A4Z2BYC6_9TELE|nr:hypothetical protein fugu_014904 [Takifugu bimaculatus]
MQTVVLGRPHSTVNDGDTIAMEPDISEHGERKQGAGWFRNRSGKEKGALVSLQKYWNACNHKFLTPFAPISSSKPTKSSTMKRDVSRSMPESKRDAIRFPFGPRGLISGLHAFTCTTQLNATTKENPANMPLKPWTFSSPLKNQILIRNTKHIYTQKCTNMTQLFWKHSEQ